MEQDRGAAAHVLLLEDLAGLAGALRDALAEAGHRITLAPDLAPADVAALAADLVVLDLRFGGGAFLDRLKADPRTAPLPVLVCSADHRELEALDGRLDDPTVRFLAKPFDLDALLGATDDLLAQTRALTACSDTRRPLGEAQDRLHDTIARLEPAPDLTA